MFISEVYPWQSLETTTRRAAIASYAFAYCDQVHKEANFGEISSKSYEDIVFTGFFVLLPAVTFMFDLLIPKSNQHICEPKYICDHNWVKFPSFVSNT